MSRLDRATALLFVVDVQEKLMPAIDDRETVIANLERIIRGSLILGLPVLVTEQYVKGLGRTIEPVRAALGEAYRPIEKNCFSATGCADFESKLRQSGRKQILVCGVETHVCVYQTASDLLRGGYEVTLIADALSSRTRENKLVALERMQRDGAKLSSTEMALFELMHVAGTEEFKAVSKLIK